MIKELLQIFDKQNIIYSIKACIAITLALGISMSLDLDKPMWAMMAALLLQLRPETGFILEKAFFLAVVSLIGIVLGFLIVNFFLPYPTIAIFCICLLIIASMYFSANMSHSNLIYGLTQTNITCTLVVLYSIATPLYTTSESVFHTGYSRITEIVIGCLCSCLVNFYILPVKVTDTLKKNVSNTFDLTIDYISNIFLLKDLSNNKKFNKKVETILNSLVTLDNNLSACKYENIQSQSYYIFLNKIIELIQMAHLLRKQIINNDSNEITTQLKNIFKEHDKIILAKNKISINSENKTLKEIIKRYNAVIASYNKTFSTNIPTTNENYYKLKNYNNPWATFLKISKTIIIFLFIYLFWISTNGDSSLLLMVILPFFLAQLSFYLPDPIDALKKMTVGFAIAIPINAFGTLSLLTFVIGYFELLIIVLLGTLLLGIATLTHPKYQMYSLGYCLGFIFTIQPSNHMDFDIANSLTIGISAVLGCVFTWLMFKIYPHMPNTFSRRLAIRSITKDIKKLHDETISKNYYQAGLIKKIISVYSNRKDDPESEKDIEFALKSLTKTI